MAKMKNRTGPFIVMILLVIAIMVMFKPVEDYNRETYGSSREGFSRNGANEGVCDHQYEFCYWSTFEDQGIKTRAEVAFETSYNTGEDIYSYSFCEARDPITNEKKCYSGEYYYPFILRYEVKGDLAYLKISDQDNDWIRCGDNGCKADLVAFSDEITYTKEELESYAGSDGKVYFYLYGWDAEIDEELISILPNDFGPDIVLDEPYIESYTTWTSQGVKFVIYPSSVGECAVDLDCHQELLECGLKGQCLPIECVRSTQCETGKVCQDNSCVEVDCVYDSDCNDGFCSEDNVCIADADGDLVADDQDNCPDNYNPPQSDEDGDGIGDFCDSVNSNDQDDDGVENVDDNCPINFNPYQEDFDNDGLGDVCDPILDNNDRDGDGVSNFFDNCPDISNVYQLDWDDDGLGDACDYYDNKPKTASVSDEGGAVYTFTVAEPVAELELDTGEVVSISQPLKGDDGINYYLVFVVVAILAIVIYEAVRKKK